MVVPPRPFFNQWQSQFRHLSSALSCKKKIAIIGSGPSAFYTSINILKRQQNVEIDMFEKTPVPFGLVRYGVAPDHPEVKNCQERFTEFVNDIGVSGGGQFKYFGNVNIGESIKLKDLYENYHSVVYAYGSEIENQLGVPGENDHPGVIHSKAFVGWYNGDPKYQNLNPPLSKVKNVTIIGNGNVAIDIVRVLLGSVKHWSTTDITNNALETLKNSTVEKVVVSARRGFMESKFTNKELKELLEFKDINFEGWGEEEFPFLKDMKLGRVEKRRLQLMKKYNNQNPDALKSWKLDYLKKPIGFKIDPQDPQLLKEAIFAKNRINQDGEIESSNEFTSTPNELVILSIGYKGEPLPEFKELGVPFNPARGMIPNKDGKIDFANEYKTKSYCVGWIANGSRGNINTSVMTSSMTSDIIVSELNDFEEGDKLGRQKIEKLLNERNVHFTTWRDWQDIEKKEVELGESSGKPFEKITNFNEMLKISK